MACYELTEFEWKMIKPSTSSSGTLQPATIAAGCGLIKPEPEAEASDFKHGEVLQGLCSKSPPPPARLGLSRRSACCDLPGTFQIWTVS